MVPKQGCQPKHDRDCGQRRPAASPRRANATRFVASTGARSGARGHRAGPENRETTALVRYRTPVRRAVGNCTVRWWRVAMGRDAALTPTYLCLSEAADRGGLVFVDFEHRVELRDLKQILDPLIEIEQLQIAAAVG